MDIFKQAGLENEERKCYELATNGFDYEHLKTLSPERRKYRLMLRDSSGELLDQARYYDVGPKKQTCVGISEFRKHLRNARKKLKKAGHIMADHTKATKAYVTVSYKHFVPDEGGKTIINIDGVETRCKIVKKWTRKRYFTNTAFINVRK